MRGRDDLLSQQTLSELQETKPQFETKIVKFVKIILEEIGLQYFSHTQRVLDKNLRLKKLCLIEA